MVTLVVSSDVPLMIRGVSAALGEFGSVLAIPSILGGLDAEVETPTADILVVDCARSITFADLDSSLSGWTARSRVILLVPDGLSHRSSDLLGLGVHGVLLRSSPGHELAAAVRNVSWGGRYLASALAARLVERSEVGVRGVPLTGRERDVLDLLAQSCTYAEIATTLLLSRHTVKYHVSNILAKLGVTSGRDAAAHWRADSRADLIAGDDRAEPRPPVVWVDLPAQRRRETA